MSNPERPLEGFRSRGAFGFKKPNDPNQGLGTGVFPGFLCLVYTDQRVANPETPLYEETGTDTIQVKYSNVPLNADPGWDRADEN